LKDLEFGFIWDEVVDGWIDEVWRR
jgi:hypothetical protein